jgi:hypothetical protein
LLIRKAANPTSDRLREHNSTFAAKNGAGRPRRGAVHRGATSRRCLNCCASKGTDGATPLPPGFVAAPAGIARRYATGGLRYPGQRTAGLERNYNPPMSSHGRSGGALIRPQHRNLISNKNHNCNASIGRSLYLGCGPASLAFSPATRRLPSQPSAPEVRSRLHCK